MAERRMFAKTIIDSDVFLEMPLSAQALYFHLSMRADDDGFLNNPRKIMKVISATPNDYDILVAKKFLIQFDDGVCVIKHWRIHNYIQKDRYKGTVYQQELSMLDVKDNGAYTLMDTECIQNGYSLEAQVRLGKDRLEIGKDRLELYNTPTSSKTVAKNRYGEYAHVLLKEVEVKKLSDEFGEVLTQKAITFLDEYIEMKGYKAKNHYLCIRKWVIDAVKERTSKSRPGHKQTMNDFVDVGKEWINERARISDDSISN